MAELFNWNGNHTAVVETMMVYSLCGVVVYTLIFYRLFWIVGAAPCTPCGQVTTGGYPYFQGFTGGVTL